MSEHGHGMYLETRHPSGAEEWVCPECGRRFVAQWMPNFRRVILERGDERAIHKSQGMDLQMQVPGDSMQGDLPDNIELGEVWKRLLDELDFREGDDEWGHEDSDNPN